MPLATAAGHWKAPSATRGGESIIRNLADGVKLDFLTRRARCPYDAQ
jgi:hypothetical protein